MTKLTRRFRRDESGATAIEYVMIAMLVALAIVSGATVIGKAVGNDFTATANGFSGPSS